MDPWEAGAPMDRLFNSRLQSSLVWGFDPIEGLLSEPEPAPVVGGVPAQWREYLDARHLNAYYARIVDCVQKPVEIELRPGLRRVSVLGIAVFELDANGFVTAYLWAWRNGALGCFAQPPERISIGDTPHGWTWLEMFRQGFVAELAWRLRCERAELDGYSRWVFARFRRRLARECDLRHMREQVRAALALDPLAVQVARRIRLACKRRLFTTLAEYNHAIAYLPAYRKLQKEAPNLVPLYAAHADDLPPLGAGEPAQLLKEHVMENFGIRQATWALAHRMRPRWVYLIEDFYNGPAAESTIDLLKVMEVLGCRQAPPHWYLWNLLQVFGHHGHRLCGYWTQYDEYGRALQRLTALIEAADGAQLRDMRERIYEVLAWIVDENAQSLRGISRAGWKWFVRHAEEWRRLQEKSAAALPGRWPAPFEEFRSHGHAAVVLRSHRELLREARAMSHCVDIYAERCAGGGHLILSIRRDGRARPLATAHLCLHRGRWRVVHVAGAANTVPRPVAVRLANEATAQINAMGWSPPAGPDEQSGAQESGAIGAQRPELALMADDAS